MLIVFSPRVPPGLPNIGLTLLRETLTGGRKAHNDSLRVHKYGPAGKLGYDGRCAYSLALLLPVKESGTASFDELCTVTEDRTKVRGFYYTLVAGRRIPTSHRTGPGEKSLQIRGSH